MILTIIKKEFNSFFSSAIAYLVMGIFLLINGLFLWVFNDDFNILNAGFADLNGFFYLAPWVLLFLIPAITMKTFAGEFQSGTIEILITKPISVWSIIFGKFLAVLSLVIMAILPTVVYIFSVYRLGNPTGNIDLGSTIASYIGLLLLVCSYASIGVFTSTLSKNQIIAFLLGLLITFLLYYGFDSISTLFENSHSIKLFGMNEHYKSMSRGVIDTRDIFYFLSITTFFLFITKKQLTDE